MLDAVYTQCPECRMTDVSHPIRRSHRQRDSSATHRHSKIFRGLRSLRSCERCTSSFATTHILTVLNPVYQYSFILEDVPLKYYPRCMLPLPHCSKSALILSSNLPTTTALWHCALTRKLSRDHSIINKNAIGAWRLQESA